MIVNGLPHPIQRLLTWGGIGLLALVVAPATVVHGLRGEYLLMAQWFFQSSCAVALILAVMVATTPPSTESHVRWVRGLGLYVCVSCVLSAIIFWADVMGAIK